MEQKTNEGWEKRYSNLLTPGTRIMAPTAQEAIKDFIHQELQKAREEQNKHIGNQLLAYYENNVDPKGELKDKWFVKLVKNLADILVAPKDQSELDQPIS